MKLHRKIYRVARSVLFTAILTIVGIYLIAYVLLSVPSVQNRIKSVAEREASAFLGGEVKIDDLVLKPFNELTINGLNVYDPNGEKCLYVETLGAGINLWRLLNTGKIEITYGEIIGLNASVIQSEENGPLNISFIIDAFKPKDKNKPPTKFDLKLRNVVLRRSSVSFSRQWKPRHNEPNRIDFNHLRLYDLRADLNLPQVKNDDFIIDLRRLAFKLSGGLTVEKIALQTHITPKSISVNNLIVQLPSTELRPADMSLNFDSFSSIPESLKSGQHHVVLLENRVTPSDFSCFYPPLGMISNPLSLTLEAEGNMTELNINQLSLSDSYNSVLELTASFCKPTDIGKMSVRLENLNFKMLERSASEWTLLLPENLAKLKQPLLNSAPLEIHAVCQGDVEKGNWQGNLELNSRCGDVKIDGETISLKNKKGLVKATAQIESFDLGTLLSRQDLGNLDGLLTFDGRINNKDVDGEVSCEISEFLYKGLQLGGLSLEGRKSGKDFEAFLDMENDLAALELKGEGAIAGVESRLSVSGNVDSFKPSLLGILPKYQGYSISGDWNIDLTGNNADNLSGEIEVNNFRFGAPSKPSLSLERLKLIASSDEAGKNITMTSDWFDMQLSGAYHINEIPKEIQCIVAAVLPSLVACPPVRDKYNSNAEFTMLIHPVNDLTEFFKLPIRFLVPIPVSGYIDGESGTARVAMDIPYIQQGKNKLLRNNHLIGEVDGEHGTLSLDIASTFPAKKGDMSVDVRIWGKDDNITADIGWITPENTDFKGDVTLDAGFSRNSFSAKPEIELNIKPSIFDVGTARWNIEEGKVSYKDNILDLEGIRIWHDKQFVEIHGTASSSPLDSVNIRLADIDLGYIFDTLNINYVTFGGIATGDIVGRGVLSKEPVATTDNLFVKDLSYNGALLGDGRIGSSWNNTDKKVEIKADITREGKRKALAEGGIWVTRDSLSFDIDANRIPVDFLAPFMSAFSSEVKGFASGNVKLFGSFSDIDLIGKVYADSLLMKLDYTNTYYHGSDSVYLHPGRIEIPSFRLYDREGHSALLTGELTHRYFHDPRFNFRLSDARHLLCYDTNPKINPDWYGTVYGNGSAVVRGWPGVVSVSVDMSLVGKSNFTFVLNDTEAAADYHFLTFSDHRKEKREKQASDSVSDIISMFRKKIDSEESHPSNFMLDVRASVTPSSLFTLVMDPIAGDKITARGNGALQMEYDTESDELKMFGKYTLEEGNYNFSLQDLILKDFVIKQGSSISFNGDPMNALLNITASYRVNTNLSDLDKSFSTDRDLNRTNVPVDALLMVKGGMQQPDISFDIELPTLTQDVERKVKSIISTDDMMSRQIIYLLALNRFYTPEYMGSSSNGGELAAVASSTLSSQLTNMIGQLTDKFTLAPSIRSDKGDFSDVEFDVALSSRLLNNRLLINGNFGYRDRNTSSTTFVGDFDIEYLLNRSGNLRLKAYNHFNDQNYYLREALTTQGLGVIFRKDFDDAFKWLRRKKKEEKNIVEKDSVELKNERERTEKESTSEK
ncbi:MAG: translocation/assembly module TamB [Muribaculaceae bacterium]|nr:translocation/assembly module TamB [Muribaculaceae bacterium]